MVSLKKNELKNKNNCKIDINTKVVKNFEIDDTDLDGEKVMMNLDKGQYFMMNEVGSRIWELIEKEITVNEIMRILLNEYEVDKKTCNNTVIEFLKLLIKNELVLVK